MKNVVEVAKQYVNAFKDVNPQLVEKYFSPNATKTGYFYNHEEGKWTDISTHSYQEMLEWTKSYNANGIMPNTEIQATLLDVQDKIAVVKVLAEWATNVWGCDYVFLIKENDEWLINAILWQELIN